MPSTPWFNCISEQVGMPRIGHLVNWKRRAFLGNTPTGMLGAIALAWLNSESGDGASAVRAAEQPQLRGPRVATKAERIICLFQNGGPSQMDLFDPKPELSRYDGKPYPGNQKIETKPRLKARGYDSRLKPSVN